MFCNVKQMLDSPTHALRTMATRGRPRLSSPERRRRTLASKAKWRDANREYYREQKNRLSSRPEYKERRKELRAIAKARGAQQATEPVSGNDTPPGRTIDAPERDTRSHTPTDAPESSGGG